MLLVTHSHFLFTSGRRRRTEYYFILYTVRQNWPWLRISSASFNFPSSTAGGGDQDSGGEGGAGGEHRRLGNVDRAPHLCLLEPLLLDRLPALDQQAGVRGHSGGLRGAAITK